MIKYKGFTVVELLVVVGIMSILLVLALSNASKNKMKTRDNIRVSDINTVRLALEQYRSSCGVFPARLELSTNNARNGVCSSSLGDFIPVIPIAPERDGTSLLVPSTVESGSVFNGYFYAGLSTTLNGPCYDYHLGSEFEFSINNSQNKSRALNEDHDFKKYEGTYNSKCASSANDFGTLNEINDDANGLYDFRSINNS